MRLITCITALSICSAMAACSLLGPVDEAPLRQEYGAKTAGQSTENLYNKTLLINIGVGGASQAVPLFHLAGLFLDAGVMVYYFDELIYGTGAIIAREKSCPNLLQKQDYWNVLGAWFKGVRSSAEFDAAMSLAGVLTPLVTSEKAAQVFSKAIQLHGAKLVGMKLAGVIAAKVTAKGIAGFVPVLGPIAAAGINWYILSGLDEAAIAYFESKARATCRA
jgi:uncharacterized membrane protein